MYAAQLKLLPGKKIELILEPIDKISDERIAAFSRLSSHIKCRTLHWA